MNAYLDTQVAVWLVNGDLHRITAKANEQMNNSRLLLSPMVLLEMEYLFEINRIRITARDSLQKLGDELNVMICSLDFSLVAAAALDEKWTRDAFDRLIVANAKANNFSYLITADKHIRQHYPRAVW